MNFSKMTLYLLSNAILSDKIHSKSKELFKNLNNFKKINLLINRYIFKNKYSKTIF
jgi:hypothetical protein